MCDDTSSTSVHSISNIDVSEFMQDQVIVPQNGFVPCSVLQQQLLSLDPQSCSIDGAVSLYVRAIHIAGQHLSLHCTQCTSCS